MTAAEQAARAAVPLPAEYTRPMWRRAIPWLAGFLALRIALALVQLPEHVSPLVLLLAKVVVDASVIFTAAATLAAVLREKLGGAELAWLFVAGVALFGLPLALRWLHVPYVPLAGLVVSAGHDVGVICLGAGIGSLVAMLLRDRNILLPAAAFAAFADYFMVRFGTVHTAMQSPAGHHVVQAMSAAVPAVHRSLPPATMGMADFVFLGLFLACARRYEMNYRATFVALATLLTFLLLALPWLGAFPAVAPMALGFVLVNLRHFKLTRAEIHATAIVFLLMAGLVGVFFLLQK